MEKHQLKINQPFVIPTRGVVKQKIFAWVWVLGKIKGGMLVILHVLPSLPPLAQLLECLKYVCFQYYICDVIIVIEADRSGFGWGYYFLNN